MVYRVYTEKKKELATEALALKNDLVTLVRIAGLEHLRILNRYDVENIEKPLFDYAVKTVFSEPQLDIVTDAVTDAQKRMSLPLNTCPVSLICVRTAPRSVFSLSRSVSARLSAVRAFTCFTEALPKKT